MTKEISKEMMCIVLRGNIEIWIEKDKIPALEIEIQKGSMLRLEGNLIKTSEIIGIFTAHDMAEKNRRLNGEWKCQEFNQWHERFKKCQCSFFNMSEKEMVKYSQGAN